MTKILLVGDSHGNVGHMKNVFAHAGRVDADMIFQLGDFGFGWEWTQFKGTGGKVECAFSGTMSKYVKQTGIPLYWLDGNHENHDALEDTMATSIPEQDGTFQHADGVFYVPRGTVMTWGVKRFLVCGGAVSVDRKFRTDYVSWWHQEAITDQQVALCASMGSVDILLTHDFPWECDVVDRHLDPYWGEQAQRDSSHNRQQVSAIMKACGATELYHGHLHHDYDEEINVPYAVHVKGLNRDETLMSANTYLLEV